MKMFLNTDKQFIDGSSPVETTLDKALSYINEHPSDKVCEDNHIGFENHNGEVIQFIRFSDGWIIDVPVLKDGVYSHSLQDNELDTVKVKEIVKRYYNGENWRQICNLTSTKPF